MQKLFYLLFDEAASEGSLLREMISERVIPVLRGLSAEQIHLFVSDEEVSAGSPIVQSDPPIRAALSYGLVDLEDRRRVEATLDEIVPSYAGYLVRESRPINHGREKAERTPGMMQMSCIARRSDISREEFRRIWHEDHAQIAIETQSTFGYVRNEIERALTEDAPGHWSAIVEEFFPIEALDDPMVFFDARTEMELVANRKRMLESCGRFLDLRQIEVTFMSEYYFG